MKVVEILGVNYEVEDHFNWLVKDVDGVVWVSAKRPIWVEEYKTWIPDGFGSMEILYAPDQPIDQQATLTKL